MFRDSRTTLKMQLLKYDLRVDFFKAKVDVIRAFIALAKTFWWRGRGYFVHGNSLQFIRSAILSNLVYGKVAKNGRYLEKEAKIVCLAKSFCMLHLTSMKEKRICWNLDRLKILLNKNVGYKEFLKKFRIWIKRLGVV